MKLFQNDINLGFGELNFEGLRLFWANDDMPWNSKKERESYLDELVNEGSEYSSAVYKRLFRQMNSREIHIKVSRSFIAKNIAMVLMGISFLLAFKGVLIGALATLGISFTLYTLNRYFVRRANELYVGLESGPEIIDFMFANRETL